MEWKMKQEANRRLQPNDYVDNDYICTDVSGELLKPDFVSAHFIVLLKNIGMPRIRFHDLRHSSGTYLHSLGFSIKEIQRWLRHKDIQTTLRYVHMDTTATSAIADNISERLANLVN